MPALDRNIKEPAESLSNDSRPRSGVVIVAATSRAAANLFIQKKNQTPGQADGDQWISFAHVRGS